MYANTSTSTHRLQNQTKQEEKSRGILRHNKDTLKLPISLFASFPSWGPQRGRRAISVGRLTELIIYSALLFYYYFFFSLIFKPQCISFYVVPVLLVCANRTMAWRHRAVFHTKCKWAPLFEKDLPENCQAPVRGVSRHVWFLAHEGHCSRPAFTVATSHLGAPLLRDNLHAKVFPTKL